MIQINKDEKNAIIGKYPDIGIVRTVKQKSKRHRYYMEERKDAMYELRRMRGEIQPRNTSNNKKKKYGEYNKAYTKTRGRDN